MPVKTNDKVLVTGASGFIGSHLVEYLLQKKHRVVALLKPGEDTRWIENLDLVRVYGDLTEENHLQEAVDGVSVIYHLAGIMGGRSTADQIFAANVCGTKNLISACLRANPRLKRFLFVSSVAAAGPNRGETLGKESDSARPHNDYGRSKLAAEKYLVDTCGEIPFSIIRLPLVYGPRSVRGLYPVFKMANRRFQVTVTKNSTTLGFVADIVRGMVQAASHPATVGQMYYLGENRTYRTDDIIRMVGAALGKKTIKIHIPYPLLYSAAWALERVTRNSKSLPVFMPRNLGEHLKMNWDFCTDKASADFGYSTEYPLADGLRITADWYKQNNFL